MLVAADTFRAGAVARVSWMGRRVDVPVVTGPESQTLQVLSLMEWNGLWQSKSMY